MNVSPHKKEILLYRKETCKKLFDLISLSSSFLYGEANSICNSSKHRLQYGVIQLGCWFTRSVVTRPIKAINMS